MALVGTKHFWYRVLDTIHYVHQDLGLEDGGAVFTKTQWTTRLGRGASQAAADRAYERFKADCRAAGLSAPSQQARAGVKMATRFRIDVRRAYDHAYVLLGAPHPGGLWAQLDCDRRIRASLMPLVVRGIAAAVLVEQQRRPRGEVLRLTA